MDEQTIKVLDKGFVTLVDHMGDDLTVVNSARVSFGSKSKKWSKKDKLLLEYLVENRHDSPFRHVQIQFRIKAPEFVMRQWYKHVVGIGYTPQRDVDHAWNEISGRYTTYKPQFYFPAKFRRQAEDNKQSTLNTEVDDPLGAKNAYIAAHTTAYKMYEQLLALGVGKEQARCVLPVSFYTEIIWTVSLQAVLNFIALRDHPHAQQEIREYAGAVRTMIALVAPRTMAAWDKFRK